MVPLNLNINSALYLGCGVIVATKKHKTLIQGLLNSRLLRQRTVELTGCGIQGLMNPIFFLYPSFVQFQMVEPNNH